MGKPLISIITVVYNARLTLEATIKSVLEQPKNLYEYWVVDGGSTDGSLELIRQYENELAGWISEPDKGIYDAMNKGIDRAKGEWIYFIGGDDTLRPGIVKEIQSHLNAQYSIVFGDVLFDNGHRMRSFLGQRTLLQNTLHHQGAFYQRCLFNDFRYDRSLFIQADYELNLHVYLQHLPTKYVNTIIAVCSLGGVSTGATEKSLREINLVRVRNLKSMWKSTFLGALLRLYYWQKQFRFWLYGHQI